MQMKRQDYTELESYCKQLESSRQTGHSGNHADP